MKTTRYFTLFLIFTSVEGFCQSETDTSPKVIHVAKRTQTDTTQSSYSGLETKTCYLVSWSASGEKGKEIYRINDSVVNQKTFRKYQDAYKNFETCKPCILKFYDKNGVLLCKGPQYTDCRVGFWIEYYPTGKVKVIGHFKENPTGNWDNAFDRGYCSRKDGFWTYFDENGKVIRTEEYADDLLIN